MKKIININLNLNGFNKQSVNFQTNFEKVALINFLKY